MKKTVLEISFLILISLIYFLINTYNINSWYYSAIGDEYAFFNFAKQIAVGETKLSLLPSSNRASFLDQRGVYGVVPVATSVYQSLVMKFFGINHSGWILSSILIVIFSFWPFYFGIKELFGKKIASLSLLIFASSHYLWAFSHTGYWNIQAIFPAVLTFYFFVKAIKGQKTTPWFLAGIASGFSFYIHYYPGISVVLIILYFLFNKKYLKPMKMIFYFLGFLLFFLPYLYVNHQVVLETILNRSLVGSQEIPQGQRSFYFVKNLFGSFLAFYQNTGVSHYVSGSLLDPITAFLFTLGLVLMLISWRKYFFLIITFSIFLIMLGGFSQYTYTPISRLYFILPIVALFSGYGLEKLLNVLGKYAFFLFSLLLAVVIIISILALNLNRFFNQTPKVLQATREAVAIKALREICFDQKTAIIDEGPTAVLKLAISSYSPSNNPTLFQVDKTEAHALSFYSCLILTNPTNPQAGSLSKKIENNFPFLKKSKVTDLTTKTAVIVYHQKNHE